MQALAKKFGVKANQKSSLIIENLLKSGGLSEGLDEVAREDSIETKDVTTEMDSAGDLDFERSEVRSDLQETDRESAEFQDAREEWSQNENDSALANKKISRIHRQKKAGAASCNSSRIDFRANNKKTRAYEEDLRTLSVSEEEIGVEELSDLDIVDKVPEEIQIARNQNEKQLKSGGPNKKLQFLTRLIAAYNDKKE